MDIFKEQRAVVVLNGFIRYCANNNIGYYILILDVIIKILFKTKSAGWEELYNNVDSQAILAIDRKSPVNT